MKTPILIVLLFGAAVGGGSVARLLSSDGASAREQQVLPDSLGLEREVSALRDDLAEVNRSLASVQTRLGALNQPQPMAEAQLRALIEEAVAARLGDGEVAALAPAGGVDAPAPSVEDLLGRLENVENEYERTMLWQEIRDAGLMDDVIAFLEDEVAAAPGDHDMAVALGVAYLEKIQEVGAGPLAGVYATKADETFDMILAEDPQHWDARFTKAMALTFWPPVFGKQGEAVKQFEILAEQQRAMPYTEYHGETWLALGNMYEQLGQHDKAQDAWIEGYETYPDHAGLKGKFVDD